MIATIPNKVTLENQKFFKTTQRAYFLAMLTHGGSIAIFAVLGITEMVWFNAIISVPAFIAAALLNRLNLVNPANCI